MKPSPLSMSFWAAPSDSGGNGMMKAFCSILILLASFIGLNAQAQIANDLGTQNAILAALPEGVTPETATADEIAQAALEVAFGVAEGDSDVILPQEVMEDRLTQVMVSLGELTRDGRFPNAPRFGSKTPPERFYVKVLNVASSNLDVASSTYYGTTVQYIIGLTAALRDGQNFLNGARSNAITRK